MKQPRYRKNFIASVSNLLKLIAALVKEEHKYQYKEEKQNELLELENKYKEFKEKRKYKKSA